MMRMWSLSSQLHSKITAVLSRNYQQALDEIANSNIIHSPSISMASEIWRRKHPKTADFIFTLLLVAHYNLLIHFSDVHRSSHLIARSVGIRNSPWQAVASLPFTHSIQTISQVEIAQLVHICCPVYASAADLNQCAIFCEVKGKTW